MNKYSARKILALLITILFLLPYTQPLLAQMDDIDLPPQITCPEPYKPIRCGPILVDYLLPIEIFNPSDDHTPIEELEFEVEDHLETFGDFHIITKRFTVTDNGGNSSYCEMVYTIGEFLRYPIFDEQKQICQDDFFKPLDLGIAKYIIYADKNNFPGEQLGKCNQPELSCMPEQLGIDVTKAGITKFWVTEFITFPDSSLCESPPGLLNIEVVEKPTAKLSTPKHKAKVNTTLNLMDFVEENTNGYWTGKGVYSATTSNGSAVWLYPVINTGLSKLYYTVNNKSCSKSYILVIDSEF